MEIEIVPDENMQEPDVEIILGIATSAPESHATISFSSVWGFSSIESSNIKTRPLS